MNSERLSVNRERVIEVVKSSLTAKSERKLVFELITENPEKQFIEQVKKNGNLYANNALFLVSSMILGEKTKPFFKRISDENNFKEFSWLFDPKVVCKFDENLVFEAGRSYFRPGGRSIASIYQWKYNCRVILDKYSGDIRNYLNENDSDALKVINSLVVRPRAKTWEKGDGFRRYGPKLARLYVQWTSQYGIYNLKNIQAAGLPVDFQIGRILIQTEGIKIDKPQGAHFVTYDTILPLLTELCLREGWTPHEVSDALWTIGSEACSKRKHALCPISNYCNKLISSIRYDKDGLFDPTDMGRFKKALT